MDAVLGDIQIGAKNNLPNYVFLRDKNKLEKGGDGHQ
jgi:hypothetical protein